MNNIIWSDAFITYLNEDEKIREFNMKYGRINKKQFQGIVDGTIHCQELPARQVHVRIREIYIDCPSSDSFSSLSEAINYMVKSIIHEHNSNTKDLKILHYKVVDDEIHVYYEELESDFKYNDRTVSIRKNNELSNLKEHIIMLYKEYTLNSVNIERKRLIERMKSIQLKLDELDNIENEKNSNL